MFFFTEQIFYFPQINANPLVLNSYESGEEEWGRGVKLVFQKQQLKSKYGKVYVFFYK